MYDDIYFNKDQDLADFQIKNWKFKSSANISFEEWSKNMHIQFINYRPKYNDYIIYVISSFDKNIYRPVRGYYDMIFKIRIDKNLKNIKGLSLEDGILYIDDWETI